MNSHAVLTADERKILAQFPDVKEADYLKERAARMARTVPITNVARSSRITEDAAAAGIDVFSARASMRPVMDQVGEYLVRHDAAHLRAAHTQFRRLTDGIARRSLTAAHLAICEQTGTALGRFAMMKRDRRAGRSLSPAKHSEYGDSFKASQAMTAEDWLKCAIAEIGKFLKDPTHLESIQYLVAADAWIDNAMKAAGAVRAGADSY